MTRLSIVGRARRAGIVRYLAAGLLVPAAAATALPSAARVRTGEVQTAQVHEDGLRTPRPPSRQAPDQHDRRPNQAREESIDRHDRSPAPRRDLPDRPRSPETPPDNTDRTATIDYSLPSWATDAIGLHPLRLSLNVQASYREYLKKANPLVFVVSRHGRYSSWRYCRPGGSCNVGAAVRSALARCDGIKIDNPCYLYAVGRKRVWKGKVDDETSLGAAVFTATGTEHRGADKAKGVIFYFRGYGAWRFPPALSYRRVPPYVHRFAQDGWDVKTVEVPYYNRPPSNLPRIVKLVHRAVAAARSQKYKKVVLAGQSRGAWEILRATDGSLPVDGVIMVAPAAHGTRHLRNGRRNTNFDRGNPAFQALAQKLKAPRIAFAFFQRDPFMPSSRAQLASDALANRPGVSLFIIRQPAGLPGHNAGWSANFARAWGGCLEKFIGAPDKPGRFTCRPERFKIEAPELIYSSTHLFEHGAKPMEPAALKALVDGKRLFTAPEPQDDGWWLFGHDGRVTMKLSGSWIRPNPVHAYWETRGNRLCILDSPIHGSRVFCYTAYRVADNVLALLMKSDIVRLMYVR